MVARGGVGGGEFKVPVSDLLSGTAIVDWDLSPTMQPARLQSDSFPPPYSDVVLNAISIAGDSYSGTYVAPPAGYVATMMYGTFTEFPISQDIYFYWKPVTGSGVPHSVVVMTPTLVQVFSMTVDPTLGLHVVASPFSGYVDPAFQLGDTVLVQITATGDVSIKTPNLVSGVLSNITLSAGAKLAVLVQLSESYTTASGQMSVNDLGSGLLPDAGFNSPTTIQPAGLPAGAVNTNILRVTVPGVYNGVNYAVNEAALVLDAVNGIVAPMAYESIRQPTGLGLYLVNVGPMHEHKDLSTLNAELASKGIFPKYLYIVYRDTTIPDSVDINFSSYCGVVLMTDNALNNVITSPNSDIIIVGPANYGLLWEGVWNVGVVNARGVRLGGSLRLFCSVFDGYQIESLSVTAEIHATYMSGAGIRIRDFHIFSPASIDNGCNAKFFANDGANCGTVQFFGNCRWNNIELYSTALQLMSGSHHGNITAKVGSFPQLPYALVTLKEGAIYDYGYINTTGIPPFIHSEYAILIERGILCSWGGSANNINNFCNLAQGSIGGGGAVLA
jgi:hypothetical protein